MKQLFVIFLAVISLTACKEENKDPQFEGEFIYYEDAAVLKGEDFIYGVTIDEQMHELAKKVAPIQKEIYDMVPVIVKGKINDKEEGTEGWDKILTITQIVEVGVSPTQADIKIENNN